MKILVKYILAIATLTVCAISCNNHSANWETLNSIESYIEQNPDSALAKLKLIDCDTLSDADRIYHHFLTVKAMDKAYIVHTTDSLILLVHEYYSTHDKERYPEVVFEELDENALEIVQKMIDGTLYQDEQ